MFSTITVSTLLNIFAYASAMMRFALARVEGSAVFLTAVAHAHEMGVVNTRVIVSNPGQVSTEGKGLNVTAPRVCVFAKRVSLPFELHTFRFDVAY